MNFANIWKSPKSTLSAIALVCLLVVNLAVQFPTVKWAAAAGAFAVALLKLLSSDQVKQLFSDNADPDALQQTINTVIGGTTKVGLVLLGLLLCTIPVSAQTTTTTVTLPSNIYAIGSSYNNAATPSIAGTALYARLLSADAGTYAFTAADILPVSKKPFTVSTNIGAGIAQKVFTFNGINVFMPTSAGVSITGTNTGWSWTGGILADYNITKSGKPTAYHIMPNVRFLKSSVSGGSDYQLIGGVLFGLGS